MESISREETKTIARDFLATLSPKKDMATVVGFVGDLGSGKTTFIQCMAELLGVTAPVTSPTFVIEKIYKLEGVPFSHLVHIDAYRLEGAKELQAIGFDELLKEADNLICVEWADRVKESIPRGGYEVRAEYVDDATRRYTIHDGNR